MSVLRGRFCDLFNVSACSTVLNAYAASGSSTMERPLRRTLRRLCGLRQLFRCPACCGKLILQFIHPLLDELTLLPCVLCVVVNPSCYSFLTCCINMLSITRHVATHSSISPFLAISIASFASSCSNPLCNRNCIVLNCLFRYCSLRNK